MELQFHPATGRGTVRTLSLGPAGERVLTGLVGAAALATLSLWMTAPIAARRWLREMETPRLTREARVFRNDRDRVARLAASLRERALDRGDLLNRIAFLYDLSPATWPRSLEPERGVLAATDVEAVAAGLQAYSRGLEKARTLLEERERADPDLPRRVPAILPIAGGVSEPAAFFGPRTSPWTGAEEFFPGVELAAPEGAAVLAAGAGVVVFTGSVRVSRGGRLWQLGNMVVISHGASGVTLYGHLAKIEVRRGERLARRQKLGTAGKTGWALAPGLHYEFWRPWREGLRPTDPLFAVLDERRQIGQVSLERMIATSVPGPAETMP
jgi:murein DD-endopeptidase MepM/ murein hydrolase activator NlpD